MGEHKDSDREKRKKTNSALEYVLTHFPTRFVERAKQIEAEAQVIEREVVEIERAISSGARPRGRKFSL